ncbi:MAG TPA: hypothetical protein VFW93_12600 [Aquabacterium sp.]|uniref:hypothetical protein n=1 Tax=Aquabacterium sp. TaxID=1872578 RepID=UPI002E3256A8|nr:hypothetical protein [Aquabacterium sp.]HEX5357055.1 hypothetical protein [Aquabacterium sp.]
MIAPSPPWIRALAPACLALMTWPAQAGSTLYLETAPPPEPGRLEQCAKATGWQAHPDPVCLRVAGQGGCSDHPQRPGKPLPTEQCFRVLQGQSVVVQGAVIKPQSARLLRTPVLVVRTESGLHVAELLTGWPAVQAAMPTWWSLLASLTHHHDILLSPIPPRPTPQPSP